MSNCHSDFNLPRLNWFYTFPLQTCTSWLIATPWHQLLTQIPNILSFLSAPESHIWINVDTSSLNISTSLSLYSLLFITLVGSHSYELQSNMQSYHPLCLWFSFLFPLSFYLPCSFVTQASIWLRGHTWWHSRPTLCSLFEFILSSKNWECGRNRPQGSHVEYVFQPLELTSQLYVLSFFSRFSVVISNIQKMIPLIWWHYALYFKLKITLEYSMSIIQVKIGRQHNWSFTFFYNMFWVLRKSPQIVNTKIK